MRPWMPLVAALVLAGCAQPSSPAAEVAAAPGPDVAPFLLEDTVWLPPSQGQERVETLIAFPVNASGTLLVGHLALGSAYGPAELPETIADVQVELRDPAGEVLAQAHLGTGERQADLEVVLESASEHVIALLSFGGSDGAQYGDHVHYSLEGKPPSSA